MKNFIDITHKNLAVKLAETREEIEKARVLRFDSSCLNKSYHPLKKIKLLKGRLL